MAIHVDEMTSEVTTESASPATTQDLAKKWEEKTRVREMQTLIALDARRTAAEGYDD